MVLAVERTLVHLAPRQLDLFRAKAAQVPSLEAALMLTEAPAPVAVAPEPLRYPSRQQAKPLAHDLAKRLAHLIGPELKVQLAIHDNKSTMISFRRTPPVLKIRLHHLFLSAPDEVIAAIADYSAKGRKHAGQALDDFIAQHQTRIRATPVNPNTLVARGKCFDLQVLFDEVNASEFDSKIMARIGWGRHTSKPRRRSIRLGVYDYKAREIRIHPALDKPDVPRFFVAFVVFHEMLHQLFPSDRAQGRHVHHPRAFRDRERKYPHFGAAMAWEHEHLHQLLRR